MGRQELFVPQETLPENRAQKTPEQQESFLTLVSTSQIKEDSLRLVLANSGITVKTVRAELLEKDWEQTLRENALGRYGHLSDIPPALAYAKANLEVIHSPNKKVIAADVILLTDDGKILGKPQSPEEAREIICDQAGKLVTQVAGTAFWDGSRWFFGKTTVSMKRQQNHREEIERYIDNHLFTVLTTGGGLPITDPNVVENFYEEDSFLTSVAYSTQGGNSLEVFHGYQSRDQRELLVQRVNGFSPELLEAMGILK